LYALSGTASANHLIASAYRPSSKVEPEKLLQFLIPPLVSSIQSNTFLDESLAVLTRSLHSWQATSTDKSSLSPDITIPLTSLLSSIASAHPNPATRFQTFRILSLLLASEEPGLRFQHLVELTGHSEFPQMRVAAVGLVKEALLQGFSTTSGKQDNIFLGPLFLRTFGPILFRPEPPDLFAGDTLEMKKFQESSEPARLVECLSLYYVLVQRDHDNLVSIHFPFYSCLF